MTEPSPAVASSPLSVLLFAHAFSTELHEAVQAWRQYLDPLQCPYELFLVQETRPEVAPEPAAELSETPKPMRNFPYERSFGFRDALNDAIRSAQYPLLVFCPADKQYLPNDLERLLKRWLEVICPNCEKVFRLGTRPTKDEKINCPECREPFLPTLVDMIVGYRAGGQAPPWRILLDTVLGLLSRLLIGVPLEPRKCWLGSQGWGRRWVARWLFGVRVSDPECPFRLVRREVFQHLPIQSSGPFVQVEMLAKANHLSCYLAEEPVTWTLPTHALHDAISFGQDAQAVFRAPDFGPCANPHLALAPREPEFPVDGET